MSKRIFSSGEQEQLRTNPNILRVSTRSITYTTQFKERAVTEYENGSTSTEIFNTAGLDRTLVGTDHPTECIQRWRKTVRRAGIAGLVEARGKSSAGRKKRPHHTETDRLKWLEAEVKYLKAENAFLAQLRAKRAE